MKNKSIIRKETGLQGKDKHNKMLELMGESVSDNLNNELEFVHECSNGNVYAIVKEQSSYHIKKAKNDGDLMVESFDYVNGIKNKNDYKYPSYSRALKQLNLYVTSINESLGKRMSFDSFKTKQLDLVETVKPKKLNLFEQYGCNNKEDFYNTITETYLNGQFKELHKIMEKTPTENKKEFFGYVLENFGEGVFDNIVTYLKEDKREADRFRKKAEPKKEEYSSELSESEKMIDSMIKPKNKKKGLMETIYEDSETEDDFVVHGTYTISNLGGYEVMLSDSGDEAKVRDAFGSEDPETSDWLEIEYVKDEDNGELVQVIDPEGYNIPLDSVMQVNEATQEYEQAEKWLKDKANKFKKFFKTEESVEQFIESILNEGGEKIDALKKKVDESLDEDGDTKYKLKIDTPESDVEDTDVDIEDVNINTSDKPFDDEPLDTGVEADEDEDPKKFIQQLAGKIAQTLRTYTKDIGAPDFELEKFVINSVISATHTAEMDSEDKKDIIKKVNTSGEGEDEKEETDDSEVEDDDSTDSEEVEDESLEENTNQNPCWKGYEQVGMKEKNGEEVPNCVPIEESEFNKLIDSTLKQISEHHGMTYTNYLNFDNKEYVEDNIDKEEDKEMTKKVARRKKPWYFSK